MLAVAAEAKVEMVVLVAVGTITTMCGTTSVPVLDAMGGTPTAHGVPLAAEVVTATSLAVEIMEEQSGVRVVTAGMETMAETVVHSADQTKTIVTATLIG